MTNTSENFYRRFMESEAGHYTLFIELAETYIDKEKVRRRWKNGWNTRRRSCSSWKSGETGFIDMKFQATDFTPSPISDANTSGS